MLNIRWIEDAKRIAYRYADNCKELERLQYTASPSHEAGGRSGRISKPTEAAVMREYDQARIAHLRQATRAVEYALAMVRQKPQGEDTVRLFEMVYRDQTHRLYGAAVELHISERTVWRYNNYLLKMIAIRMGYLPIE